MTRLIGLDVGYGFVKVTDGRAGYSFPSVVGEGHNKPTFNVMSDQLSVVDDMKIGIDDELYFVGKSAIRHSKFAHRDLSYTRAISDDLETLFFSALSPFCNEAVNRFRVITGLPVERMHLASDLAERVRGEKMITIYSEGNPHEVKIDIDAVEVVPQPLGTYWSVHLNSLGQISEPMEGRTGIIDVGFRTTDLAAIEDSEYIPEKSKTVPLGLVTAYSDIASYLATTYGLEKESYDLDSIVIKGKINVAGETIDITEIINNAFQKLAVNILVTVNSNWKTTDFDKLVLSGGGGQSVSDYVLPKLSQAQLTNEPITANSRGYLSWANRYWGSLNE
ncbi:MAG: ParM/StbA family protein [Clostridiales bacterium]|nr:ParM/StbA family protein [Clostridiales bacterium]